MKELQQIYAAVASLEQRYAGRKFTPDGIMVGTIGEVLAEEKYCITLLPPNTQGHDARDTGGRLVQIKTNQGDATPLRDEPQFLIAQKLLKNGTVEEIYNGPGNLVWTLRSGVKPDRDKYYHLRHNKLRKLMPQVPVTDRIATR